MFDLQGFGMKRFIIKLLVFAITSTNFLFSQKILIPMDLTQTDHLKSYGLAYWTLKQGQTVDWLLNYRGGSFMTDYSPTVETEARLRGISFEIVDGATAAQIYATVQSNDNNMELIHLEKPPKIAVYATPGTQPWDDAVLLALNYAQIDHDVIWDEEVLQGKLSEYDWLHLHHEDFTGQYGKFWASYSNAPWYIEQVTINETMAKKLGFSKVSEMKRAVALKIREYVANGGFLFAMCSATDTYDIALAAQNVDICESMFDGDPAAPNANSKLDYSQTLAFENFKLVMDPFIYEFSDIDCQPNPLTMNPETDYFTLFEFSAKFDPVPTMLTQNHVNVIKGFLGQTTAFHQDKIKKNVVIMGIKEGTDEVKYLHGNFGRGMFTFYGGHDPEDYQHAVGDPPTDLSLHKNSPGYRLILNNVLFPAAKKKTLKT
jgi:hypothetical protein